MPFTPPYTLANLLEGTVRVVYAPAATVMVPAKLDDIMTLATPYALKTGWLDAGATSDSTSYERDMDSSDREIQQSAAAVIKRITSVTRTLTIPLAEITPEFAQIIEGGNAPTVIAAGAAASGTPAQKRVAGGTSILTPRYRVAFVAQFSPEYSSGEEGARGKFYAKVLYSASFVADKSELQMDRDDGATREIGFEGLPESTISDLNANVTCELFETGAVLP